MTEKKVVEKPKKTVNKEEVSKEVKKVVNEVIVEKEAPVATKVATKVKTSKAGIQTYYGTGKRKSAIAKVWIFKGTGLVTINKKSAGLYVGSEILATKIVNPLKTLGLESEYDCKITCLGGGIVGQVGACQLGISRALLTVNPEYRKPLKVEGFLTRDPRVKERKKYGRKKARKGFQFRKR